ncbi:MAG TPA: HD domain-containing protein [Thermoleophilia bacterium]|nr:HD domain-containing protein [Thermoleophilia bacterium]
MALDRDEIVRLTTEYGGEWGISHTRRLLELVDRIGASREYDREVIWLAAHLHDWGGYRPWAQPGVDHAERSTEVAAEFLRERACPQPTFDLVIECIRTHHSGDPDRAIEAVLLSDADGLDFLGAVGVLRDFSKKPKDMRAAYDTVRKRRGSVPARLCLDESRQLAAARLAEMDEVLAAFEHSSFGLF